MGGNLESAKLIGLIVTILAAIITGTENRLLRRMRNANALQQDSAIDLGKVNIIARWRLGKLHNRQIILQTASGLYFLDETELKRQTSIRRKRAFGIVAVLFVATLIYFILR